MDIKVSILIPVYKSEDFISQCIQSVLKQTYTNLEIVIVDDATPDNSMKIIGDILKEINYKYDIKIYHNNKNEGIAATRNIGIKAATGDYIYFLDSDDAITTDCIEILTQLAKKHPLADYIQGEIITGEKYLMEGCIDKDVPDFCNEKNYLENIILSKAHRTSWNKLIKRSFLIDNSLFFPIGLVMEDHYWTYFVAKTAQAVAFCHKGTYYYYKNNESIVNSRSKASYIRNYTSYLSIIYSIVNDLLSRKDIQSCHRKYVGEAIVFSMINLSRLHSLRHWCVFWKFIWGTRHQYKAIFIRKKLLLFLCMTPPICFMTGIKACRWRIREHIIGKL